MHRELDWPTPLTRDELRDRWIRLCRWTHADANATERTWDALARAYAEPLRRYHTLEHLGEVFALLDTLSPSAPAPALELAVWTHDVVYEPTRSDNEAASAEWSRARLPELGFPAECVARVQELVLVTASHRVEPADEDAMLLTDADLAILGSPPTRYGRYVGDVRAEFGHLDDDSWRRGRTAVVAGFLERPAIYHHPRLQPFDTRARHNLADERQALRGGL